jgi:hypothetical protein
MGLGIRDEASAGLHFSGLGYRYQTPLCTSTFIGKTEGGRGEKAHYAWLNLMVLSPIPLVLICSHYSGRPYM